MEEYITILEQIHKRWEKKLTEYGVVRHIILAIFFQFKLAKIDVLFI